MNVWGVQFCRPQPGLPLPAPIVHAPGNMISLLFSTSLYTYSKTETGNLAPQANFPCKEGVKSHLQPSGVREVKPGLYAIIVCLCWAPKTANHKLKI